MNPRTLTYAGKAGGAAMGVIAIFMMASFPPLWYLVPPVMALLFGGIGAVILFEAKPKEPHPYLPVIEARKNTAWAKEAASGLPNPAAIQAILVAYMDDELLYKGDPVETWAQPMMLPFALEDAYEAPLDYNPAWDKMTIIAGKIEAGMVTGSPMVLPKGATYKRRGLTPSDRKRLREIRARRERAGLKVPYMNPTGGSDHAYSRH